MIVVADASPLIFMAKLRRLDILPALLGTNIRVPASVQKEVVTSRADDAETDTLKEFLQTCRVETVKRPRRFASGMSRADNEALTLAIRSRADILICDDRITRLMAEAEGVRPLGTLGIILRAKRRRILTPAKTRELVDALVGSHGFRIGIELYQAVLFEIES